MYWLQNEPVYVFLEYLNKFAYAAIVKFIQNIYANYV